MSLKKSKKGIKIDYTNSLRVRWASYEDLNAYMASLGLKGVDLRTADLNTEYTSMSGMPNTYEFVLWEYFKTQGRNLRKGGLVY